VTVSLHHIVIDAHDLPAQARFWTQVLSWKILSEREREVVIGAAETASVGICFMPVTDSKTVKNRLHLDLSPGPDGREAEVVGDDPLGVSRRTSGRAEFSAGSRVRNPAAAGPGRSA
jgi:hypothetical protein